MNKFNKSIRGDSDLTVLFGIVFVVFLIIAGIIGSMFAYPVYNVWASQKQGEAQLAQAQYSKQVAVQEAQAKDDSAKLLAEAEVKRAEGVAAANKIIGDSLKNNEDYLRYLFVNNLAETHDQIIYIPTEAGLPILEANRPSQVKTP